MRRKLRGIPPAVRGEPIVRGGLSFKTNKGPQAKRKPWVFAAKPKFARIEQFREPLIDVFEEADEINIILDVPGFKEEEIRFEIADNVLKVSAKTFGREWEESIVLPEEVDENKIQTKYQNAVLEITLSKKKEKKEDADKK